MPSQSTRARGSTGSAALVVLGVGAGLLQACAGGTSSAPVATPVTTVSAPAVAAPSGPPRGLVMLSPEALTPPAESVAVASPPAPPAASPGVAASPVQPEASPPPGANMTVPPPSAPPVTVAPSVPPVPTGPPTWRDDGTDASLQAAIAQSLIFYRTLPADTVIPIGPLTYTADEMARSLELFLALRLSTPDPAAFAEQVRRNFIVFESIAEQSDNLFTGYYEPHIPGSLTPTAELSAPVYARPGDLVEVALEDFGKDLPKRKVVGRVQDGRLVPYYSREEIEGGGVLEGRAQPLAYVNGIDLFFLQIQGSGQVELPDGRKIVVGYDASNGQPYRALGAEMIRRNLMAREDVSLDSLKRYLADHRELVPMLLNTNPSYVFFRKLEDGRGPLGNLQVPLTPGRSLAADRLLLPPGVLAYVMTSTPVPPVPDTAPAQITGQAQITAPASVTAQAPTPAHVPTAVRELDRFMLIQDTGGAIRGHGRGDLFWGDGPDAEWMAGHAKQPGRLFILVARKDKLPPAPPASPSDKKAAKAAQRVQPPKALGRPLQARMP
jgi:membrane-bound lytic murein transglycosylase A